ncbi:GSCOCT00010650001.3-RA-CDS [Cotesia congregata]|uniref:Odorant binding protein 139.10651 n=1 Tax=Cotesia congregata TaxID=51543 RepID=A0A8J2E292_COTCN|nr:GSCOCT00010650001.3-RA-CDS [Cotesia congregata]CAG5075069.1 Odorant binding protein 139.10651 [Cotesia congregata]
MATLYSTVLACFLLAAVTSAEPVNYNDILLATYQECKYLNDSSNDKQQNEYYRSLLPEEKYIVTNYGISEYLACFIKKLNLFTLEDYKVYKDGVQYCLALIDSNSTITDPDEEQRLGNICILKTLKTIKSDNSIDAEVLKKYLTVFVAVTDELFESNQALEYFNNCVNEKGSDAEDTISKFLECIDRNRNSKA